MQFKKYKALNKHKLFYKYLMPYVLIMLIPTLIFAVFINTSLFSRLREGYIEDTAKSLNQFMEATDRNISQLEMIRDHVLSQPGIAPPLYLEQVDSSKTIIGELKKYTVSNGFIKDIALYVEGDDYIYTSGSTHRVDALFSGKLLYQKWPTEEFLELTNNLLSRHVRPAERVSVNGAFCEVITVIYPVQIRNSKVFLMFLVDTAYLDIEDPTSSFFITNPEGQLLYSITSPEIPREIYDEHKEYEYHVEDVQFADNSKYLTSYVDSYKTGWRYHKITTRDKVYGDFFKIQNTFYGIILGVMIIGGVLIYISMTVNYNPLRKLKKFAEDISDGSQEGRDTIKSIEYAFKHLVSQNSELKGKEANIGQTHFLLQLLKGRVTSKDDFNTRISELALEQLKGPYYFVFIVVIKSRGQINTTHKVEPRVVELLINQLVSGYIREHSESGKFVFIGSLESKEELLFTHSILDIQGLLQEELDMDIVLATSSICKGYDEIPQSYMEASLAIDYSFIKGNNCVIDSSQLVLNEDIGAVYPQKMFDRLDYQIKNGDVDKIEEVLDEIIDYIKNSNLPLYYVKGLCYQLINNISSMIEYLNYDLSIRGNKFSYATALADFETVDGKLMEAVRNISINICSFIRDEKTQSNQINDIKDYIMTNYMSGGFSVQNMAEYFGMAAPTISLLFKNECNITIIDYVTELRMDYAKQLLLEEKYTLNDIVTTIGYLNTSSFIRKFKSIHGLTPGQYIKHNKERNG